MLVHWFVKSSFSLEFTKNGVSFHSIQRWRNRK
jgi:hypothetical protein